jgi:hypothetical protein
LIEARPTQALGDALPFKLAASRSVIQQSLVWDVMVHVQYWLQLLGTVILPGLPSSQVPVYDGQPV